MTGNDYIILSPTAAERLQRSSPSEARPSRWCGLCHTGVAIAVIVQLGCAPSFPNSGMNTSYDARKLRAVGLYVMPSKSPDDDQLLSNVFALDLLSRGYRVIDMNRIAAEQGVQVDASDHGDVMDFLASVGLSQSPDVILVARPVWTGVVLAWKSDPRMATFRLRNYGVFKGLDLDVGMFDVASRDTVLAVSLRDTARILRDNKTFRDYEEPTRYGLGWERWDREGPFH